MELKGRLREGEVEIVWGLNGLCQVAKMDGYDFAMMGMVGSIGLVPAIEAIQAGKNIGLANKEILVSGGELIKRLAKEHNVSILPVDSEHSAIFQCLVGESIETVERLILTASGGPFLNLDSSQLTDVTKHDAANHPTWTMGEKVSIDCSTLMNKGLEVIEARWLFDVGPERIRVAVHPTSVVHSMIELVDGSFKAQLGETDMRHPIQYALSWPDRWPTPRAGFDPIAAGPLEFEAPDTDRFPCLALAYEALRRGGAAPAALNAANEEAVRAFLDERVGFTDIARINRETMERHAADDGTTLAALRETDGRARRTAAALIEQGVRS